MPGASARLRVMPPSCYGHCFLLIYILRLPQAMQQELEETFFEGKFSWDGRRTNDASTLLKQFLRFVCLDIY